ncbi:hypothetical protein B1A85_00860 [Chroococcidiopsis sp. TS-821]|nr:hypothetical protein B1A85_00860 [Chroococcidiopsis sp. TS-821]
MSYNAQHYNTFAALLQMRGLPIELAKLISGELAQIDNDRQDRLIETFTVRLYAKQVSVQEGDSVSH